jgi:hypothetical protein
MLLGSMTYKEFFDAYEKDAPKVKYKLDSLTPKAFKILSKEPQYPAWKIYDYTIPESHNTHYFFYYADGYEMITNTFFILEHGGNKFYVRAMRMGYRHTPESDMTMLPMICIYTKHFLERYRTRYLHDEKIVLRDVAGIYFARNETVIPINLNDEINRNYKKYGEQNFLGIHVRDGFCFTDTSLEGIFDESGDRSKDQVDAMRIIYTSYYNIAEMEDSQKAAINKECQEVWERCLREIGDI